MLSLPLTLVFNELLRVDLIKRYSWEKTNKCSKMFPSFQFVFFCKKDFGITPVEYRSRLRNFIGHRTSGSTALPFLKHHSVWDLMIFPVFISNSKKLPYCHQENIKNKIKKRQETNPVRSYIRTTNLRSFILVCFLMLPRGFLGTKADVLMDLVVVELL